MEDKSDYNFKGKLKANKDLVIFVGETNVGKTALLNRYVLNTHKPTSPSIGIETLSKQIQYKNKSIKLNLWDTAGQERYVSLAKSHYRNSQGVILMYDITREDSFSNVTKWLDYIKFDSEPDCVIFLLGNKIDLESVREVNIEDGKALANEHKLFFDEISAMKNNNVEKVFEKLIEEMIKAREMRGEDREKGIELNNQASSSQKSSKCC